MQKLDEAAKTITLSAALRRIERKAEIMRLDAQSPTAKQDAEEISLLVGIAIRCAVHLDGSMTADDDVS